MSDEYQTTRGRILNRIANHVAAAGACEHCGSTASLKVFWRDPKAPRPFRSIHKLFNAGADKRAAAAELLIVLCHGCVQIHKSGVGHGGGVRGIRNCPCEPCKARYREYFAERQRVRRDVIRARDARGPASTPEREDQ